MINQQLLDYIKQQQQQGITKASIYADLVAIGWQPQDIQAGFVALEQPVAVKPPVIPPQPSNPATMIKRKSRTSVKKLLGIIGGIIILIITGFGFLLYQGYKDGPEVAKSVTGFIQYVADKNIDQAYLLTSTEFKKTYPKEEFTKSMDLLEAQYSGFSEQKQTGFRIEANIGQPTLYKYSGTISYIDGDQGSIVANLIKEEGSYRIQWIEITIDVKRYDKFAQKNIPPLNIPSPLATPVSSPAETQTLAPPGTTEYGRKRYRAAKATIEEAKSVQKRIGNTFGSIEITNESVFTHSENYKGITIKWTDAQVIPPDRLAWIKSAIDILPPYFISDHPIGGIYSAQHTELGLTTNPVLSGASAYASGFNIFLTSIFTNPGTLYKMDKQEIVRTLFHEWMHVVQHYEILETFTEEYLSIPGNLLVVMPLSPFNKEFAKSVGWEFVSDEYADSTYAKLKDDPESQKTTDYGKTSYIEDIAETMSSFMLCDASHMSQARIIWAQNQTGKSANDFCPAKL